MEVIAERDAAAYAETVAATSSIQVFGTPGNAVLEVLGRQAEAGVPANGQIVASRRLHTLSRRAGDAIVGCASAPGCGLTRSNARTGGGRSSRSTALRILANRGKEDW
jgi:hypothetical protein